MNTNKVLLSDGCLRHTYIGCLSLTRLLTVAKTNAQDNMSFTLPDNRFCSVPFRQGSSVSCVLFSCSIWTVPCLGVPGSRRAHLIGSCTPSVLSHKDTISESHLCSVVQRVSGLHIAELSFKIALLLVQSSSACFFSLFLSRICCGLRTHSPPFHWLQASSSTGLFFYF